MARSSDWRKVQKIQMLLLLVSSDDHCLCESTKSHNSKPRISKSTKDVPLSLHRSSGLPFAVKVPMAAFDHAEDGFFLSFVRSGRCEGQGLVFAPIYFGT